MKTVFEYTYEELSSGAPAVIATVIASSGSTPRSSGARMLIRQDGTIEGTIGGGIVEAMVQQSGAKAHQLQGNIAVTTEFALDNSLAAGSGMICGGNVTVLLERIEPEQATVFCSLTKELAAGYPCVLLATYSPSSGPNNTHTLLERSLNLEETSVVHSTTKLSEPIHEQTKGLIERAGSSSLPVTLSQPAFFAIAERHTPLPTIILFGAGHVAVPTSKLAAMTDFRVVVVDDRDEFANEKRFPDASQIHILQDFQTINEHLTIHQNCYVVIVTRGHQHDKTVLQEALKTPARYIGMIGSKRKRDSVYDILKQEGVLQESIDRCHCPIGISIGAQTPEEIAVSIMAEIIQARHC